MNKKVKEQFIDIKDIYLLQCICSEQDDEIERLNNKINNLKSSLDFLILYFSDEEGDIVCGYDLSS